MKTYIIKIDEEKVVFEIEETAKAQCIVPEDLIAILVARALAPQSLLARRIPRNIAFLDLSQYQ